MGLTLNKCYLLTDLGPDFVLLKALELIVDDREKHVEHDFPNLPDKTGAINYSIYGTGINLESAVEMFKRNLISYYQELSQDPASLAPEPLAHLRYLKTIMAEKRMNS